MDVDFDTEKARLAEIGANVTSVANMVEVRLQQEELTVRQPSSLILVKDESGYIGEVIRLGPDATLHQAARLYLESCVETDCGSIVW